MPVPTSITPAKRRRRRRRRAVVSSSPPPLALTLVSASFSAVTTLLRLTFNKPVDVSGIFPGNLIVDDGEGDIQWEGQGPVTFVNPSTIDVGMFEVQAQAYPDTRLNAAAPTGIVAADGGEAWAGVAGLLLPFP